MYSKFLKTINIKNISHIDADAFRGTSLNTIKNDLIEVLDSG